MVCRPSRSIAYAARSFRPAARATSRRSSLATSSRWISRSIQRRRLRGERPDVRGRFGVAAGNVEDAERLARDRMPHQRGGAGRAVKGLAVVLGGKDLHRLPVGERGADPVRADVQLSPAGAQHDADLFTLGQQLHVAALDQDQAIGIRQGEAERRSLGQVHESIDDVLAGANQELAQLAAQEPFEAAFDGVRLQRRLNTQLPRAQPRWAMVGRTNGSTAPDTRTLPRPGARPSPAPAGLQHPTVLRRTPVYPGRR